MYVPRAMYSLRMSFLQRAFNLVKRNVLLARHCQVETSKVEAVALMVIEVDTLSSGMPQTIAACLPVSLCHSDFADSPLASGSSESNRSGWKIECN